MAYSLSLWIVRTVTLSKLLSVLPVVPILATPHTGYMAGVGFVLTG